MRRMRKAPKKINVLSEFPDANFPLVTNSKKPVTCPSV